MAEKKTISSKKKPTVKPKVVAKKPTVKKTAKAIAGLTAKVYNIEGRQAETINLPETIFGVKPSDQLLAQYVRVYLNNQRQGTHSVKTRAEVTGSTRKIYRQKGTGRARHGARSAPIFVGGGVTFGPKPKDYHMNLTKKQIRKAFLCSLSTQFRDGTMVFVSGLLDIKPKTKNFVSILAKLPMNEKKSTLIIYPREKAENLKFAVRNIARVDSRGASIINAYDLLSHQRIIFAKEALLEIIDSVSIKQNKIHEN